MPKTRQVLPQTNPSQFKCKYCGDVAVTFARGGWTPIVDPLQAEIWAGYHVKGKHRELIPKMAKGHKPWSDIFEKRGKTGGEPSAVIAHSKSIPSWRRF